MLTGQRVLLLASNDRASVHSVALATHQTLCVYGKDLAHQVLSAFENAKLDLAGFVDLGLRNERAVDGLAEGKRSDHFLIVLHRSHSVLKLHAGPSAA